MEHKKLNLVQDNRNRLEKDFSEILQNYLKPFFESRYKPLIFKYDIKNMEEQRFLMINLQLSGSKRTLFKNVTVDHGALATYNFDIVQEHIKSIEHGFEEALIQEAIKALN